MGSLFVLYRTILADGFLLVGAFVLDVAAIAPNEQGGCLQFAQA
jgi:hypothetical protein